jgi:hypothetical protein
LPYPAFTFHVYVGNHFDFQHAYLLLFASECGCGWLDRIVFLSYLSSRRLTPPMIYPVRSTPDSCFLISNPKPPANSTTSECTPKALTHRITAIKKKAGTLAASNGAMATPTPASSPATSSTPDSPSAKTANPRKRAMKSDATTNGHAEDKGPTTKKAKTGGSTSKRTKKCAAPAPVVVKGEGGKKVKHEDGEDDDSNDDDSA